MRLYNFGMMISTDLCLIACVWGLRAAMTTRFIDQAAHVNPVLFWAGGDNLENLQIKSRIEITASLLSPKSRLGALPPPDRMGQIPIGMSGVALHGRGLSTQCQISMHL